MANKIKFTALIGLAVILLLGFAYAQPEDKPDKKTNEALNDSSTTNESSNATIDSFPKEEKAAPENKEKQEEKIEEKPEKEKAEEKPEPNVPPVWKSDVGEFVLKGKNIIDLSEYFYDANNDSLAYLFTTPSKIEVGIDGSIITLNPKGHNFTTLIEFTATDGEQATTKEVKLIVPEKSITISLGYKQGSDYDADDDGYETTTGIIDMTVENSLFSWDVDESKLCTKWEIDSIEDEKATTVCYGSKLCCNFIDLEPTRGEWDEVFYSTYGQYGATSNNIVSAQILYVDYGLSRDESFAEIYNSQWKDLAVRYYSPFIDFEYVCVDTCILSGFNDTGYMLIFEITNAVLNLNLLAYSIEEAASKVIVSLAVKDSDGSESGVYHLYKDNSLVTEQLVNPGLYRIDVIPADNIINKVEINANITEPLSAAIGVDNISRELTTEQNDIKKKYAVNLQSLNFEKAALTANATANSLYQCRQWDFEREVCFGIWEKKRDLVVGEEYEVELTPDSFGFIEGDLNITAASVNLTELLFVRDIPNVTISKNGKITIDLRNYFSGIDDNSTFTYYEQANLAIMFDNSLAAIMPNKDFVGTMYTYITAHRGDKYAISNLFPVNVANETNLTPIVSFALINELPNATITKNNNATINLSDYFSDLGENTVFTYYKHDNVSISFGKDIATIAPGKDFTGTVFTYVTANKSSILIASNIFSITVKEAPIGILNITELVDITDPIVKSKLTEYADANLKPAFRYSTINFTGYQVTNEVVIIFINIDGKDIKWLTSLNNFKDVTKSK